MDKMYDIATSFVDIFTYVRNNVGRVSGGHRHLLQANSAQPSATDIAKAVVSAADAVRDGCIKNPGQADK